VTMLNFGERWLGRWFMDWYFLRFWLW